MKNTWILFLIVYHCFVISSDEKSYASKNLNDIALKISTKNDITEPIKKKLFSILETVDTNKWVGERSKVTQFLRVCFEYYYQDRALSEQEPLLPRYYLPFLEHIIEDNNLLCPTHLTHQAFLSHKVASFVRSTTIRYSPEAINYCFSNYTINVDTRFLGDIDTYIKNFGFVLDTSAYNGHFYDKLSNKDQTAENRCEYFKRALKPQFSEERKNKIVNFLLILKRFENQKKFKMPKVILRNFIIPIVLFSPHWDILNEELKKPECLTEYKKYALSPWFQDELKNIKQSVSSLF